MWCGRTLEIDVTLLLQTRALTASYGERAVLEPLDIGVREGCVSVLLGANGAGKTTTLRALCQMMVRTGGEVHFAGRRMDMLPTEAIVRLGVAQVPDGRGTFTHLTVEENLRLGAYTRRDRTGVRDDHLRMYALFPRLLERRHQQAGTLSGGEQQMLAIARALMLRPRLLLLDEPSFGLAPVIVKEIFALLARIRREEGVSMLLVEQNAHMALDLADDAYVLETGRLVLSGSPSALRENAAIQKAYLGL